MKNKILLSAIGAAALAMGMYACQDAAEDVKPGGVTSEEITLPVKYVGATDLATCKTKADVIYNLKNGELNWVKDSVYCLCGDVRVPATKQLNIAAGTVIRGQSSSRASLTVLAGATINAIGSLNDPIIFTSSKTVGQRAPGDWGGLIILGNAQVNPAAPVMIEGFPNPLTAPRYGSNTDANNGESSGTLRYVRIEFGGIALPSTANSEKNGLTMGGVGSGTSIDHIQVSSGADDGFEWFGGTVNAKYLISHKNVDDDFDTDFGFQGKVQYGVVSRDPARFDISGSNGFESDNDGSGSTATPRTAPLFSNFTIIGPIQCSTTGINTLYNDGIHLRRRSGLNLYNSVVVGWRRHQIFADATIQSIAGGAVTPNDALLSGNLAVRPQSGTFSVVNEPAAPNNVWTTGPSNVATTATVCSPADNTTNGGIYRVSGLPVNAWNLTAVNFTPLANSVGTGFTSPILTQGVNANAIDPFFDANTTTTTSSTYYIGARRGANDSGWNVSTGWINWQPETLSYPNDADGTVE